MSGFDTLIDQGESRYITALGPRPRCIGRGAAINWRGALLRWQRLEAKSRKDMPEQAVRDGISGLGLRQTRVLQERGNWKSGQHALTSGQHDQTALADVGYRFFTATRQNGFVNDGVTMTQIPNGLPTGTPTPLRRSAVALESAFLAEMLKSAGLVRASTAMNGSEGEEQFVSFLADAQARAIVARGGLGLADSIERALIARSNPAGGLA